MKTLITSKVPLDIPSDAIVIIEGVRTPVSKANRGALKNFKADQFLAVVLKVTFLFRLRFTELQLILTLTSLNIALLS